MTSENPSVPYGYCHCGCGGKTRISDRNCPSKGWVKGQPYRFLPHHATAKRAQTHDEEVRAHRQLWADAGIPYGYCLCGCGERTVVSPQRRSGKGYIKGEPRKYLHAHGARLPEHELYREEDRGYITPCWITTGAGYPKTGYARINDGHGRGRGGHIVMWERRNGPVPKGLVLDHLCSVRPCIRPEHLEPVTPAENVRRSKTAKLTWAAVIEIRELLKRGEHPRDIAPKFGVHRRTIVDIERGRSWKGDPP